MLEDSIDCSKAGMFNVLGCVIFLNIFAHTAEMTGFCQKVILNKMGSGGSLKYCVFCVLEKCWKGLKNC